MAVASRLAGLFDDYGQSRPGMLRVWAAGDALSGDETPLAVRDIRFLRLWKGTWQT